MRITESITLSMATLGQLRSSQQLADLTEASSTGIGVNDPSDNPVAWENAARLQTQIGTLNDRNRVATRTAGDLNTAESTLAEAGDVFVQAKQIAVEMANGSLTATDRANEVSAVQGLKQQLLSIANTQGATGYLFGGSKTQTPPFDSTGTFTGNDDVMQVEVADGVTANANTSGARAFTAAGGTDLFAALDTLATALGGNDVATIQSSIDTMTSGEQQLISARVDAGLSAERLTSAASVTSAAVTSATTAQDSDVNVNPVSVYSQLQNAQNAYARSVDVTRQILSLNTFTSTGG